MTESQSPPRDVPCRPVDRLAVAWRSAHAHAPWTVFFLGLALLSIGISRESGVTGQDEYWLSFRTPMEMLARGDWLTPWLNGAPRFQKPPLVYWFTCATYTLDGVSLVAARSSGVLAGAALAAFTAALYRRLFGASGLVAGLLVLGSLGVAVDSRRCMLDVPLATFVTLAVLAGVRWGQEGRHRDLALCAAALTLAFLTKGPAAWLFFGIPSLAAVACRLRPGWLRAHAWQVAAALGAALLLSLLWPLAMRVRWPEYASTVAHETRAWRVGQCFAPPVVFLASLGLAFPWSVTVFAGVARVVRGWRNSAATERWLVVWYLASVLPFVFMRAFERYLQPVVPVQALLAARVLLAVAPLAPAWHARLAIGVQALAVGLFGAFLLWFGLGVPWTLATLGAVGALAVAAGRRRLPASAAALAVAVVSMLFLGVAYPTLGINALPADLERNLAGHPVAVYGSTQPAMLSMRLGRSVTNLPAGQSEPLTAFGATGGFVFTLDRDAAAFEELAARVGLTPHATRSFQTFYSRKSWVRFARQGTTGADWAAAFRAHDLRRLATTVHCYRLHQVASPTRPSSQED